MLVDPVALRMCIYVYLFFHMCEAHPCMHSFVFPSRYVTCAAEKLVAKPGETATPASKKKQPEAASSGGVDGHDAPVPICDAGVDDADGAAGDGEHGGPPKKKAKVDADDADAPAPICDAGAGDPVGAAGDGAAGGSDAPKKKQKKEPQQKAVQVVQVEVQVEAQVAVHWQQWDQWATSSAKLILAKIKTGAKG